ncbi:DUF1778 domain-containing protein [soil metagenome]
MTDANRKKREMNLNIRVTPQQKQVIAQAAQLKQTTVSNFVLEQALEAALDIVVEQRNFILSTDQWKVFCDALEAAPREYPRLRKLLTEPGVFDKN